MTITSMLIMLLLSTSSTLLTNTYPTPQMDLASIEFQRVVFNKPPTLLAEDVVTRSDVIELVKEIDSSGRYEALIYVVKEDEHRAWIIVGRVHELNGRTGSWDFIEVRSTVDAVTVAINEVRYYQERNLVSVNVEDVRGRLVRGFSVSSKLNLRLPLPEGYYLGEDELGTQHTQATEPASENNEGVQQPSFSPTQARFTASESSKITGEAVEVESAREINVQPIVISFTISVILSLATYFIIRRLVSE